MTVLTEPQMWTALGILAATLATMITLVMMTMRAKFGRVDEQFAQVGIRFEMIESKFETKFDAIESKFESRFEAIEAKFDARFETMLARMDQNTAELRLEMQQGFARLEKKIDDHDRDIAAIVRRLDGRAAE